MKIASRLALGTIGILGIAGLALGAAGAAHAGTMPIVRPGEPTVAMTITCLLYTSPSPRDRG